MQFQSKQFNRMTLIKALTALVIIVAVLMVGAICTVSVATKAANHGALSTYESWVENLTADAKSSAEEQGLTVSNSLTEKQLASLFEEGNRGFEGVAIVTSSGHVLYDSQEVLGNIISTNVSMPREGASVSVERYGDKSYALAVCCLEGEYFAVGYIDFTANAAAISKLRGTILAVGIVSAVFVVGAFVAYVLMTGFVEKKRSYRYKLITDFEGRILRSNDAFKADFPQTMRIYENVARFSDSKVTAVKIPDYDDDVFIACAAKKTAKGNVKLTAAPLTMPRNAQATQPRDMMREAYSNFISKNKPFLLGLINFADLPVITDMFGQIFAERVHGRLCDRVAERFTYLYVLDTYHIGVLSPDSNENSMLMRDLMSIINGYNDPLKIEENIVNVKVKCGFAVCDNSMAQRNFEYAMTAADAALRRASQDEQKDYYIFYGTDMKSYSKYFFNYDIRQMLEDNLFEMEYQPQYGIQDGRIVGFEALFRVKKKANVFVDIFDLISYAERSGNMVLLGEFIFDTAMRFAKRVEDKNVTVSLNVSPVQLMQAGFCESFLNIYDRYEIKSGVVCVEITESFLMQNFEYAIKKLQLLHEHGILVHLDDFGTRYSSLLYLKKLPVQVIKIDREFVIDVNEDAIDRSITEMIVNICKKHNMLCIAEGVETKEQYDTLKDMGVDIIQGFYIGKSVSVTEACQLIEEFELK